MFSSPRDKCVLPNMAEGMEGAMSGNELQQVYECVCICRH